MYVFRLWFPKQRLEIARAELEPHRQQMLNKHPLEREKRIINRHFDAAIPILASRIHPLQILRGIITGRR